ncbi:MAG: branched-chain amino acid ABC transporter permease/ATP-binding protein [Actinomycetota bacterium]|nr:branched-chain amino acid ABC transporter permease/ATP-binding protein [Actinomycetota bacterium]MDA3018799.1 branched-chain amino acid ABC transporter permease/ATP-binding protein [Actinomycetota bacterium]
MNAMIALTYSNDILFDGLIQGLVYSLVAFGLLLIYRATGVINFAHGQIGAFGGYVMALLQVRYDIPYGLSLPIALLCGVLLGVAAELVLRRLFTQPRLLLFVATLGLTQVIQLLQLRLPIPDEQATNVTFPVLISGNWKVAGINVTGPQLTVLLFVPVLMIFLGWLFHRSAFGMNVRATADNFSAARLAGIGVRLVSTKVWALAGLMAAFSALLIAPLQGGSIASVQNALGPKMLLLSLVAAMVGRMKSFTWTLVGGLLAGVIDRFLITWSLSGDLPAGSNIAVLFVVIIVVLFTVGRSASMKDETWQLTSKVRAARVELTKHPLYRVMTLMGFGLIAALALVLPSQVDKASDMLKFSSVPVYLIIALSVTVITGWGGQLSLGQFGFVALGSYLTIYYANELPYLVSLPIGVLWGVIAAVIVGIPALRVKGLYLAVVTLGFGLAIRSWFIVGEKFAPGGGGSAQLNVDRNEGFRLIFWTVKGKNFDGVYYFTLLMALLSIVVVWRIRKTGIGRSIIATRDNETASAAYTVAPNRAKLLAFAVSGGLAALGGGLLPLVARNAQFKIDGLLFNFDESLRIVSVAVVGGIGSITGALLGTLLIIAVPLFFDGTKQVELFASGFGMLIVLLYFPSGLISIVHAARDNLLKWIARRSQWTPPVRQAGADVASLGSGRQVEVFGSPLVTKGLCVTLGGRTIVDDVSLEVRSGEVVGLIGTNGAGKTTIVNAISGFVPSSGLIELFGQDVSKLSAYKRARLGQGRAFQNARLFSSLTVRETLMVALESRQRSLLIPSILALPPSPQHEGRKRREADEIISYLGLGRYADSLMGELSTGTRRIVELGALIALDSKLMLLDEPTAGVAQRETEAFGPLIRMIKEELGASILIIEHDMPMVMSISDRIYCLEAGHVIAEGVPDVIRNNPAVIASYLGTDERAIQRSNTKD